MAAMDCGNTPSRSIILQSVWATLLIVFWGRLEPLLAYVGFTLVCFAALAVAAVIVLRVRRPDLPRPYKVPFYPVVPILFVAVSAWMAIFMLRGRPTEAVWGLVTVLAGVPFYFFFRKLRTGK
jgi:basic amino acid/polyamine antiporter, APA family